MRHSDAKRPNRKILILLMAILLGVIAAWRAQAPDVSAAEIPALAPQWQSPPPGLRLSTNAAYPPQGADGPAIARAPSGPTIMAVYSHRVTSIVDRDPYYTIFNGQSWSTPAAVRVTPGTDSGQLALTYGAGNAAHLVWDEPGNGLVYMRHDGSGWGGFKTIAATTLPVFGADISAYGNNIIDVVWAAKPGPSPNPNVYHSRSTDGGNTWSSPAPIIETAPTSQAPKIAHDANGVAHVVWQERTAMLRSETRYVRGLPWSQPIVISSSQIESDRRPALAIAASTVHVAFARSLGVDSSNSDQWAYYTQCSSNCTAPQSWSLPMNASGQPVRVNESAPFDLIPEIASHDGCAYIFYHGYVQNVSSNEVIWNVNSCDGWSGGGRDQVTGFDMRGIYPRVVMVGNAIRLVYEWVDGNNHQIYTMHGILPAGPAGGIFLPAVARR